MFARNYYVVLGVPASESSTGIRQAFRELALRYHPDRAGAPGDAALPGARRSLRGAVGPRPARVLRRGASPWGRGRSPGRSAGVAGHRFRAGAAGA
jgi:hypothetical protein